MVLHSCVERDHIVYQIKVDGKLVYVTGEDADLVMNMLCGVILIVHLAQIKDPPHLCDMMDYQNDIKQQYIYYRL